MTIYLTNAFSLNMLKYSWATIEIDELNIDEAKQLLSSGFVSAVGHEATAKLLSLILNMDVKYNRIEVALTPQDTLVVFQLLTRLQEGAILDEKQLKQLKYKFYAVRVVDHGLQ